VKFFSHVWISLVFSWSTASLFATEYIFTHVPVLVAPDPHFVVMQSYNPSTLIYLGDLIREYETGFAQGVQLMAPNGRPGPYLSIELMHQYYPNWKVCYLPRLPLYALPTPYIMMVKKWVEIPVRHRRPPPGIPYPNDLKGLSYPQPFVPNISQASEPAATSTPNPWSQPPKSPKDLPWEWISPIPVENPQGEMEEAPTDNNGEEVPLWLRRATTRATKGTHDGVQPIAPLTLNERTDTSY